MSNKKRIIVRKKEAKQGGNQVRAELLGVGRVGRADGRVPRRPTKKDSMGRHIPVREDEPMVNKTVTMPKGVLKEVEMLAALSGHNITMLLRGLLVLGRESLEEEQDGVERATIMALAARRNPTK